MSNAFKKSNMISALAGGTGAVGFNEAKTGNKTATKILDPFGIFQEGGIFGGPADHPADAAQAAFLQRMMGREGELYPLLQSILSKSTGNANAAYKETVGEANKLYPSTMEGVRDFKLSPGTLSALNSIRDTRTDNTDADVNSLVKDKIAALAGRGVTSADTAAGTTRNVDAAMVPAMSQADVDYQNSLLTMPGDLAMKKYGLASAQGGLNAAALKDKYSSVINPYLDMWRTSAGIGSSNPATTQPSNSAASLAAIAQMVGSFTNKPKDTTGFRDYGVPSDNYVMMNRGK